MKLCRRKFLNLAAGVATLPVAARAQQGDRVRRVAVAMVEAESDPAGQTWLAALRQRLQQLGWIEGRNLRLDVRFNARDVVRTRGMAQELVSLAPDVIVVTGVTTTRALQEQTQTVPIVFVQVGDPVDSGVVSSIARPDGNTTGITNLFPSIAGKWVELLKEAAPHVTKVALIFRSERPATEPYLASLEAAAAALAVRAIRTPVRNATEIEYAIDAFATEGNGGLIIVPVPESSVDSPRTFRVFAGHGRPATR